MSIKRIFFIIPLTSSSSDLKTIHNSFFYSITKPKITVDLATNRSQQASRRWHVLSSSRNLIGSFSARRKPCYFENFSSPFPRPLVDEKFGPAGSRGFDIVERMVRGGARLTRKRERERSEGEKEGVKETKRGANEEEEEW